MRRCLPLLAIAAVSGCGGASSATSSATTAETTTATKAAPTKPAGTKTVSIKNFDYQPVRLTVNAGTTVRWVNKDASNHTVTGEGGAKIKLGNIDQGKKVQMRFTAPGTYKYYCEYHPNMHARIVVR